MLQPAARTGPRLTLRERKLACALHNYPIMTAPILRILAPVDDSEAAPMVLTQAFDFAQRFRASLEVLHVWSPQEADGVSSDAEERAHKFLASLFDACDAPFTVSVTPVIERGAASDSILAHAAQSDLIVMAASRPSPQSGPSLGATATKVLGLSACPVLLLRPECVRDKTPQ